MDLPSLALLGVVTGVLLWRALTRERRDYARFKRLRSTIARQKVYRRWLLEGFLALGGLSAATIVGASGAVAPVLAAAQEWPPVAAVRGVLQAPWGGLLAAGVALALVALLVLPVLAARGTSLDEAPAIGDIRALLPRSPGELRFGAALSLNAGVFEELLFRLGLPALVFAVTGDAVVAFVGTTLLFGVLHVYQGPLGIVFSTILGAVFAALYLVTGWILAPILLHALIDMRSMVLIPVVLGGAARTPGPRPVRVAGVD